MFGFITVRPGALSVYWYITLRNDVRGEGLLQKYFLGETIVRPYLLLSSLLLNRRSMTQKFQPKHVLGRVLCVER